MKQRLLSVLNIKDTESKYIFDLLSIQLFIGIANSFINIVAFTFFIHHFAVTSISYAYLVIAGFLLLLNVGYEKLEQRLSPLHLLRAVIAISALVLFLFWVGLLSWDKNTVIFSLLVWSTLFYMVTGYAYWGLVSLLFNIRESKRVFSIVGSGDIPAKLIGYVAAPLLIPVIGIDNLLLFSIVALGVGFFLLHQLIRKKRWQRMEDRAHNVFVHHHHSQHGHHQSTLSFLRKNKLIFFISLLSLLSYNVFNLIDYTFVTQIKARIQNLSVLATYIAVFFAAGRIITLILKLVFTSRMIERLGIITCLMITPVTLAAFCVLFVLFDHSNYTLYEFGIMAMLTEVLRSAMQEPVFFILFQPLSEHNRLKGHIIAKGYMLAPSLLIVGASLLLAAEAGWVLTIPVIIKVLLANLLLWGFLIYHVRKAYTKELHHSIAKGVFNSDGAILYNESTINILLEKVKSGNASEKIYALRLLENVKYADLYRVLEEQLHSKNEDIKNYAFDRLHAHHKLDAKRLHQMIVDAQDEVFRTKAVKALCSVDAAALKQYTQNLDETPPLLRRELIAVLLRQKEFTLFFKGCNELQGLLHSAHAEERDAALGIIGELKEINFTDALTAMFDDADDSVKRNAYLSACKLRSKALLPLMLQKLRGPDKYLAMQGLFQYGDTLFNDLQKMPHHITAACSVELIKVASKVKGPHAIHYLLNQLREHNAHAGKVVHSLWIKGYQAEHPEDIFLFERLLNDALHLGLQKTTYSATVPDGNDKSLLKRAIDNEIWDELTTALKVCAILYPKMSLNRTIELTENKERRKLYNAMEMLELTLPKKTASQLNELLDYLLDAGSLKKLPPSMERNKFYKEVVLEEGLHFNHWTRSLSLYSSWRNKATSFYEELKQRGGRIEEPVFSETQAFVFTQISEPHYADH